MMFLILALALVGSVVSNCPPGYKITSDGNCVICPKGSFQAKTNGRACWNCLKETYADARGSSVCRKCPPNHFTARTGSESYHDCIGPKLELLICSTVLGVEQCQTTVHYEKKELSASLRLKSLKVLSGVWDVTKVNPDGRWDVRLEEGLVLDTVDFRLIKIDPIMNNIFCYTGNGREYKGTYSVTKHDTACLNWKDVNGGPDHNYCRGSKWGNRPWCYVPGDLENRAILCSLPKCVWDEKCKKDKIGADYRGTTSSTEQGYTCQNWNSNTPHIHYYEQDYTEGIGDHNYCRNPTDDQAIVPWCYTTQIFTIWDYCSIRTCDPKKDSRFEYVDYPNWT